MCVRASSSIIFCEFRDLKSTWKVPPKVWLLAICVEGISCFKLYPSPMPCLPCGWIFLAWVVWRIFWSRCLDCDRVWRKGILWELLGMYAGLLEASIASMIKVFDEALGECLDAIVAWVWDPSSRMFCLFDLTSCPKIENLLKWFLIIWKTKNIHQKT